MSGETELTSEVLATCGSWGLLVLCLRPSHSVVDPFGVSAGYRRDMVGRSHGA